MHREPKNQFCAALSTHSAQRDNSVQFLRITQMLYVLIGLLALSSTALAQVEPAAPGSIEYSLTTNHETWVLSSAPITIGAYVEDLLTDRLGQPDGRGSIGIVTDIGFDPDPYNVNAATVDFGRGYSAGIVFPELSAVDIVPVPEPSTLLLLLPGALLWRAALNRRCG
jgi:hypothetical protein